MIWGILLNLELTNWVESFLPFLGLRLQVSIAVLDFYVGAGEPELSAYADTVSAFSFLFSSTHIGFKVLPNL